MNQWVYFWITFFLGFFGVHKFVRGKIGIGILYIFTGGLFGIGWLYDCITALSTAIKADARTRAVAEADAAAQALAAEQAERARADEDARKRRREIRAQSFSDSVEAIPRVLVGTDGEKTAVRSLNTLDPHYSTITVRSKLPVLSNFISVDIETCGLRVTMPILEVTAIKFADFKPVAAFTTLIDPGKAIPEDATRINGITDEMVKGAPSIWQIMPSLNAFVGGMPIVGHNLPLIWPFYTGAGLMFRLAKSSLTHWPLQKESFLTKMWRITNWVRCANITESTISVRIGLSRTPMLQDNFFTRWWKNARAGIERGRRIVRRPSEDYRPLWVSMYGRNWA